MNQTAHVQNTPIPALPRARLVPRGDEGRVEINRTGQRKRRLGDLYIQLLQEPWHQLLYLITAIYLSANTLFAAVYLIIGDGIENADHGSFADAFFFSVQTMSTIGYGKMSPVGLAANVCVTVEVLTGFVFFAMVTGLVFSKFSRPTARVLFSNVAVICPYDGKPHLMLRLANERDNRIVDANIHMVLLRKERTTDGHSMRRFHDLSLVRSRIPLLQLSWTLMHPIDDNSPLKGVTPAILKEWDAEIIVSLVGLDETFSQTIHARWSYVDSDIRCNATFVDIMKRRELDNGIDIDYTHFHEIRPIAAL